MVARILEDRAELPGEKALESSQRTFGTSFKKLLKMYAKRVKADGHRQHEFELGWR